MPGQKYNAFRDALLILGRVLFSQERNVSLPSTVGEISIDTFESSKIPYAGSVYGISEIFGLGQELELISDREMKAFGWCFSLDGVTSETLIHDTSVVDPRSKILWYYAYAHYDAGAWIGQCVY